MVGHYRTCDKRSHQGYQGHKLSTSFTCQHSCNVNHNRSDSHTRGYHIVITRFPELRLSNRRQPSICVGHAWTVLYVLCPLNICHLNIDRVSANVVASFHHRYIEREEGTIDVVVVDALT